MDPMYLLQNLLNKTKKNIEALIESLYNNL